MLRGASLTKATAKLLIALFALSCVSRAHPWRHHAPKRHPAATSSLLRSSSSFELDTDLEADRVTLQSNGFAKTIKIRFGDLRTEEVGFTTGTDDDGNLVAGDIDSDGDVDLIWVGGANRNNAVVLLNRGEGSFAEVSDSASYASELDELFNTDDSPHKRSLKKHRKSSSLISSSFSDIGVGLETWSHDPIVQRLSFADFELVVNRVALLTNIRKRGPPSAVS